MKFPCTGLFPLQLSNDVCDMGEKVTAMIDITGYIYDGVIVRGVT